MAKPALKQRIVGLLGGSFNPAHDGHIHISEEARERLGLNEIWWLVSPQNPLKDTHETVDFDSRVEAARRLTKELPFVKISDIERNRRSPYSIDTITALQEAYSDIKFIWLMGADNLENFDQWHRWRKIFATIHIAVFHRYPHRKKALNSIAAKTFAKHRAKNEKAFLEQETPSWIYIPIPAHHSSSTEIRKQLSTTEQ